VIVVANPGLAPGFVLDGRESDLGANAFGQSVTRREDQRLLTGHGSYTADQIPPGSAHAVMLRSPHAHATILSIDASAALAMPGVLAVITGADIEAAGLGTIAAGSPLAKFPGTPADQDFAFRPAHPVLASTTVRFVGDPVAMVVADSEAAAIDAAEQIFVDYDIHPCVTGTKAAAGSAATAVWPQAPDNRCFRWQAGDGAAVEAAFAKAARIVRLDVLNTRIHVASLENRGAVGFYDPARDSYTLLTGTQMPHGLRDELACDIFRIPPERIRVKVADVGGSFGIKNAMYPEQALVLFAARKLGRAVTWIGGRSDSFVSDYQARDNVTTGELALDAEGHFLGLRVRTVAAIGAYLAPSGQLSPTTNTPVLAGVYRLPCIHVAVDGVFSHTAPTEVYRGAGRPESVYLLERLVDQAAHELGVPPWELRARNLLTPDAWPYRTPLGLLYDSGDFPGILEAAKKQADLDGFAARRAASEARGKLRGIGMAQYCERVAGSWSETGWIELKPDGRVLVMTSAMSNGQGHETAFAQLISAQLGIDADLIEIIQGDTARTPSGHGTGGSASLGIAGAAISAAGTTLVQKALPLAAEALEAAEVDVLFAAGRFVIAGTDRSVGWDAVVERLNAEGLAADGFYKPSNPTFPNGCHIAEIELDPDTGEWRIERYTMMHDFGLALNPMLLEGQMQGGVAQGIGQAFCERVVHDESGQVLTGSFMDYQIPRADDLPSLELIQRPTPSPANPLGIKGCGEAGAAGGCPTVMNALYDALWRRGVRKIDMPATPERVWMALQGV
jgi:carbon-monoxide dehydrogenase large subunit